PSRPWPRKRASRNGSTPIRSAAKRSASTAARVSSSDIGTSFTGLRAEPARGPQDPSRLRLPPRGPLLDPETPDLLRRAASVPDANGGSGRGLTSRAVQPRHLKRYKDLGRLVLRYGDAVGVRRAGFQPVLEDLADEPYVGDDPGKPEELAAELERLGPTFVKLGQILSTRPDLLPAPYLDALSRLQDDVEPVPFGEIERVVQEELGARMSKAFAAFDPRP